MQAIERTKTQFRLIFDLRMKIVKIVSADGTFTGTAIAALLALGLAVFFCSLTWIDNLYVRILGFCVGLMLIASAGYAGRSKALGLRVLGRAEWDSARSTYRQ